MSQNIQFSSTTTFSATNKKHVSSEILQKYVKLSPSDGQTTQKAKKKSQQRKTVRKILYAGRYLSLCVCMQYNLVVCPLEKKGEKILIQSCVLLSVTIGMYTHDKSKNSSKVKPSFVGCQ